MAKPSIGVRGQEMSILQILLQALPNNRTYSDVFGSSKMKLRIEAYFIRPLKFRKYYFFASTHSGYLVFSSVMLFLFYSMLYRVSKFSYFFILKPKRLEYLTPYFKMYTSSDRGPFLVFIRTVARICRAYETLEFELSGLKPLSQTLQIYFPSHERTFPMILFRVQLKSWSSNDIRQLALRFAIIFLQLATCVRQFRNVMSN